MGEMFRHMEFPFPGGRFPPELAAVTQQTVLEGKQPALLIVHTAGNDWLVGDGVSDPNLPSAASGTHLSHLLVLDPSLAELCSLPLGFVAERASQEEPWRVRPMQPDDLID